MSHETIKLFSTEGCHLCEQARVMISELNFSLEIVDIAYDDALFSRYGVTIPVVSYKNRELNWPFTKLELEEWLV
jgi:glutaredoxin